MINSVSTAATSSVPTFSGFISKVKLGQGTCAAKAGLARARAAQRRGALSRIAIVSAYPRARAWSSGVRP
jgi:formate hydrogenlyase subunit 3/multisubunit Na+/H+ antiporter MnhD subunit